MALAGRGRGSRRGQSRYGLLLLTLVATYLVSAVSTPSRWGGAVHVAFITVVTLLAVGHTRLLRGRRLTVARCVLVATALAAGACATADSGGVRAVADGWGGLMLLLTVIVIIRGVVRLDEVTPQALYAAFSAYLLIGMMFAAFFAMIDDIHGSFFAHGQPANPQTLQYFSFTTLTTLGYGDFTAAGSLGRAVAVLEALAGQVFLATLVARLVSAYGPGRRRPPSTPADPG
jgi:hypothetical protein